MKKKRKNKKRKNSKGAKKPITPPIGLEISYAWKYKNEHTFGAIAIPIAVGFFYIIYVSHLANKNETDTHFFFIILLIIIALGLIYPVCIILRSLFNKTYIYVDQEHIDIFTKPFKLPGDDISISVRKIIEFNVEFKVEPLITYFQGRWPGSRYEVYRRYAVICEYIGSNKLENKLYLTKEIPSNEQAERIKKKIENYLKELQRYLEDAT